MNYRFGVVLASVSLVFFAGCTGFLGIDENKTHTATEIHETTDRVTPYPLGASSHRNESQRKIIQSGEKFGAFVGGGVTQFDHTEVIGYNAFSNNTLVVGMQTDGDVPLYHNVMDGVQAIGATTILETSNASEPTRYDNGTLKNLYQPKLVKVFIENRDGHVIGKYDIKPSDARDYRQFDVSVDVFTSKVIGSLQHDGTSRLGSRPASWYLNRSELTVWANDYEDEVQQWWKDTGDRDDPLFPVKDIEYNATRFEILHDVEWNQEKFEESFGSASSTMLTAYWRTTLESSGIPPKQLNIFIRRNDGENYASYMERENVLSFLNSSRGNQERNWYLQQEEHMYVVNGTFPFDGF